MMLLLEKEEELARERERLAPGGPPMEYKNLIEGGLFPFPPKLKELKEKILSNKGVKEVIGRSMKEGRALPLSHSLKSLVPSSPKRQQVSTR